MERETQHLDERLQARTADAIHDLLLRLGDLSRDELALRTDINDFEATLASLADARRIVPVSIAGEDRFIAAENAAHTKADRDRKETENKYKEYSAEELDRARKAIESSKLALEKERERLKAADANLKGEREARLALEKKLKAALDSLAQIAAVKEEARGVVITLSGAVLFASGQSTLLPIARAAVLEVVAELAYRRNAEQLRAEIEALPGPQEAVRVLERLAAGQDLGLSTR